MSACWYVASFRKGGSCEPNELPLNPPVISPLLILMRFLQRDPRAPTTTQLCVDLIVHGNSSSYLLTYLCSRSYHISAYKNEKVSAVTPAIIRKTHIPTVFVSFQIFVSQPKRRFRFCMHNFLNITRVVLRASVVVVFR